MATLRAVKPEIIKASKPKFMISGKSGVGKTFFSLSFPTPYFIDTEGGAVREQYKEKLIQAGGAYFGKEQGSQDFNSVIEEIKTLATTKHGYKSLVIDSFSYLYNLAAAIAEVKVGNDFGKDKKEANRPTRQLMRWLETLDMSVILICHQRDKWERRGGEVVHVGTTFDGFDKMEYGLDLWIEVSKTGSIRTFIIKKSRIQNLPEGTEYPLDYAKFSDLYGKDIIDKASEPINMATEDQVKELERLLSVVKIEVATLEKWKDKAKAETWAEMTSEQINGCISYCKKELEKLTSTPAINGKGGK
jgi:hypothetical protein